MNAVKKISFVKSCILALLICICFITARCFNKNHNEKSTIPSLQEVTLRYILNRYHEVAINTCLDTNGSLYEKDDLMQLKIINRKDIINNYLKNNGIHIRSNFDSIFTKENNFGSINNQIDKKIYCNKYKLKDNSSILFLYKPIIVNNKIFVYFEHTCFLLNNCSEGIFLVFTKNGNKWILLKEDIIFQS